jgi:hypothetical protein
MTSQAGRGSATRNNTIDAVELIEFARYGPDRRETP